MTDFSGHAIKTDIGEHRVKALASFKFLLRRAAWHFIFFAIVHGAFFTAIMISSGNDISGDTCIRNSVLGYEKSHPNYNGCSIRWGVVIALNIFMTTALTLIFLPMEMIARGIRWHGLKRISAENPNWKYLSIIFGFALLFYIGIGATIRELYGY